MEYLAVRNWEKWQSYRKDRGQPPWIKLHRRLLRNIEWISLTDTERGHLVSIWLLAAEYDGHIPASSEIVKKLCFLNEAPNLEKLTELCFLEPTRRQTDANVTPQNNNMCVYNNNINTRDIYTYTNDLSVQHDANLTPERRQPDAKKAKASKSKSDNRHLTPFTLPNWLSQCLWKEFLSHRKSVKAPVSKESYPRFVSRFEKLRSEGWEPDIVISHMTEKGWRWFKPEWIKEDGKPDKESKSLLFHPSKEELEDPNYGIQPDN